jgi:hypothetical protein
LNIPRVVGLPVEEAMRVLETAQAPAVEIENVAVPADFRSRRPADNRRKIEYVAAQWSSPEGMLRLRVVSVPFGPKETGI